MPFALRFRPGYLTPKSAGSHPETMIVHRSKIVTM